MYTNHIKGNIGEFKDFSVVVRIKEIEMLAKREKWCYNTKKTTKSEAEEPC